ncbi:tetratricopeptide repeat protein [Seminibacterium arietis]|uniref:Tetratricopeptide repeat protein n=1 Tax=Seminibacterium arietis TaxID=1173502 RepID=A0ABW3I6Z8_9PAST
MKLSKKLFLGLLLCSFNLQALPKETAFDTISKSAVAEKFELTDQQRRNLAQYAADSNNWNLVFDLIYPLAKKGDRNAQVNVGILYMQGRGVAQNNDKAYWWLSEAAEKGSIKAINHLALMYLDGLGVKKNVPHAIKLLEKTAKSDSVFAMFVLGAVYYQEIQVQDFKKAFIWFEKSARNNHNESKFRLATMYEQGKGVKQDTNKAIYWYQETLKQHDEFSEKAKKRLSMLQAD